MLRRKGQNIAEYSILIALIIAAAVAMQTYVKRGLQGRMADAVDHAPNMTTINADFGVVPALEFGTRQYEPYYTDTEGDVFSTRGYTENVTARGDTRRDSIDEDTTRAAGAYDRAGFGNWTSR